MSLSFSSESATFSTHFHLNKTFIFYGPARADPLDIDPSALRLKLVSGEAASVKHSKTHGVGTCLQYHLMDLCC